MLISHTTGCRLCWSNLSRHYWPWHSGSRNCYIKNIRCCKESNSCCSAYSTNKRVSSLTFTVHNIQHWYGITYSDVLLIVEHLLELIGSRIFTKKEQGSPLLSKPQITCQLLQCATTNTLCPIQHVMGHRYTEVRGTKCCCQRSGPWSKNARAYCHHTLVTLSSQQGVPVVVAAGNIPIDACNYSPASSDHV